jgi:hypothetical protein
VPTSTPSHCCPRARRPWRRGLREPASSRPLRCRQRRRRRPSIQLCGARCVSACGRLRMVDRSWSGSALTVAHQRARPPTPARNRSWSRTTARGRRVTGRMDRRALGVPVVGSSRRAWVRIEPTRDAVPPMNGWILVRRRSVRHVNRAGPRALATARNSVNQPRRAGFQRPASPRWSPWPCSRHCCCGRDDGRRPRCHGPHRRDAPSGLRAKPAAIPSMGQRWAAEAHMVRVRECGGCVCAYALDRRR